LEVAANYDSPNTETDVIITGAIGLVGYTIEAKVNGVTNTGVVGADGEVTIVVNGSLSAGTYVVTARVTNAGAEYGSFQTVSLTV
jgi:hypothetical protein